MGYSLLSYLFSKEQVGQEVYDTISGLPEIVQGELLTVYGDIFGEEDVMFERGIYLSMFYYLCCVKEISTSMLE